jgi:molecular chaperone DnaK
MFQIDFDNQNEHVIGIDLGTTNSLAAWMNVATPEVIPGEDGDKLVPSVVSLLADRGMIVGNAARIELIDHPERTIYSVKRLMGRGIGDVQDELRLFPFRIVEGSESVIRVALGEKTFTPPEISAFILRQLRKNAEAALGATVSKAVITVPAYFNDAQRQATRDAGRIAGLDVLRLVNEPTAAALAYGLDKRKEGIIAVYDLGGGTFDISILKLREGIFEVLATNGDTHLGGDDIDNLLLRIALEDLQSEWGRDLSHVGEAVQTLRRDVIRAKEALSFAPGANIEFEWDGKRYIREITRDLFEGLIRGIVDRTLGPCRDCMRDAGVAPEQIDEVVLVGGSTRIPLVRSAVEVLFPARRCRQAFFPARSRISFCWTSHRFRSASKPWAVWSRRSFIGIPPSRPAPARPSPQASMVKPTCSFTSCKVNANSPKTAAVWPASILKASTRCPPAWRASKYAFSSTPMAFSM